MSKHNGRLEKLERLASTRKPEKGKPWVPIELYCEPDGSFICKKTGTRYASTDEVPVPEGMLPMFILLQRDQD